MLRIFVVVAVDYDGTLTMGSRPDVHAVEAIANARARGVKVVLTTGRILAELQHAFPEVHEYFDAIVAENGAVLTTGVRSRCLARPVPPTLEDALARRGVPVRGGEVLLACDAAHDLVVLEEIHRLGLDHQLVYNRAALMILPAGVSKGTGLCEALDELGVSRHSAIAIGDAENDHALLEVCELGVAVANAVPSLRERADVVLDESDGAGVADLLLGPILRGDERVHPDRWRVVVGRHDDGTIATLPATPVNILITGDSNSGKSYLGGMFAEGVIELGYAVLILDFEGDHSSLGDLPGVLLFDGADGFPRPEQVTRVIHNLGTSVVVDLSMLRPDEQDSYVAALSSAVDGIRRSHGVPQWLFVDEAHRAFGAHPSALATIQGPGHCLITWSPDGLLTDAIAAFDIVVALRSPDGTAAEDGERLARLVTARAASAPDANSDPLGPLRPSLAPRRQALPVPRSERGPHRRRRRQCGHPSPRPPGLRP